MNDRETRICLAVSERCNKIVVEMCGEDTELMFQAGFMTSLLFMSRMTVFQKRENRENFIRIFNDSLKDAISILDEDSKR